MEEWEKYFRELLGGIEYRIIRGKGGGVKGDEEEEPSREEIRKVLKCIRDGKAMGGDDISGEVWKYEEIRGNTGEKNWRKGCWSFAIRCEGKRERVGRGNYSANKKKR